MELNGNSVEAGGADRPGNELRLVPGGAGSAPAIEIQYDGTAAPLALFEALDALGCGRATVEPPPRSAIDWQTPDPERGTTYTIAPYCATTRLPVSGPDVARVFARAVGLAAAHGVRVSGEQGCEADHERSVVSQPEVEVEVVIEPHRELAVSVELDRLARCVERQPTVLTKTNTYRGRTCETELPAIRLTLVVDASRLDDLLATVSPVAAETPRINDANRRVPVR